MTWVLGEEGRDSVSVELILRPLAAGLADLGGAEGVALEDVCDEA